MYNKNVKVFSGFSNMPLAQKIAHEFGISLSPLDIHIFPDGERRVRVLERVVNEHCIVVQPTAIPADQNYMELFFIADALKRTGALSVTAVVPYLGYQRQDHVFRTGEARSLAVIIQTIEAVGIDKLITFDLHSVKIPELFRIPVSHLSALPIFADKIKTLLYDASPTDAAVLVSPDMGGKRRVAMLSEMLGGMDSAAINKDRNLATGQITGDVVEGMPAHFGNGVKKKAFIIDDMISTGGTIAQAAKLLANRGVDEMYCFATHPVFSGDVAGYLQESPLEKIFVTDSIAIPPKKQFAKLEILSISPMIAQTIRDIL